MEEKVLKKSKNGLAMVTLFILLYAAAIAAIIVGSIMVEQAETKAGWIVLIVAGGVYAAIGWIFFIGLKVLKPQEALVLTLFGKYVGTIKEAGFYFVNPFCVAVNPAASTKLNQSGDVTGDGNKLDLASMAGVAGMAIAAGNNSQSANKKISLKIMTLSNSRQKINDCLGNPVEIGIAVMWKVTDTAKAVFNVDNYKEYLSLQCDSALRNIVRMYPYDVAENVDTTGDGIADEGSLRGSSEVVAERIRKEIQGKVADAGLEATRKEIEALGVTCRAYAGNAADFEETDKVVKQIHADFGSIDVLVNNAGITKDGLMLRMSEAQWDAVLNVNLKSAFNFIHACAPIMLRQRSGSIINMSSVVGVHGNAGQCNYSASKAGMIGLAKSIAQELGPKGVRANAIAPGFIETPMTAQLPEDVRKDWMKKIPLRRGGQTEDIANVCLFLASDMSSYVSGQVIQVDGGMNM